jgi:LPXTG-motif cell wall-anchored protein
VRNATVVHVTKSGTPVWMVAGLAAAAALIGGAVGWLLRQRRKPV